MAENFLSQKYECRICGNPHLSEIISLGNQYLVNFLDSENQSMPSAPLDLVLCDKKNGGCGLLQLKHTVSDETLYRQFWYKSGVNQTMIDALSDITSSAENLVNLNVDDIVLDIGANDGTLLRSYKNKNIQLVGFEPATNLIEFTKVGTNCVINNFFNYKNFEEYFPSEKAKIITSIAMFYDLENPNEFVDDIAKSLDDDGLWIIQMNYLTTMLENNAFDNIVHEHLEYYSLNSLEELLKRHNLEIFDIELNDVNGGSVRTYIKHKKCNLYPISPTVEKQRKYEENLALNSSKPYLEFANRIKKLKDETLTFIKNEVKNGKKIYIYGASTRGNTLLQFYGIDSKLIPFAIDRNPMKWGKKIVGTDIKIISEEQARKERPDYFFILPWYFLNEFRNREKEYLENGGKFIVPLPTLQIIN